MKRYFSLLFSIILIVGPGLKAGAQIQKGQDLDGDTVNDHFGYSVSMPDAYTLAVGVPQTETNSNGGYLRVFSWNGNSWIQKGPDIVAEASNDFCGIAVSMPNANTVAVGANLNDGNGNNSGHVRVFSWNNNTWEQKGADLDGEFWDNQSGSAISMPDENTIAIGAKYNNWNGVHSGHVRIYRWNGNNWIQKGVDLNGPYAGTLFGSSVSMPDSNTIAVGAPVGAGIVFVYKWIGTIWYPKGNTILGLGSWRAGTSVSMPNPNMVAIGMPALESGHVGIFAWNGSSWIQKGGIIVGEAAGDSLGNMVSMPDTNFIAISAYRNDGNGNRAGHVRIYQWNGIDWVQYGSDIDGEAAGDQSGFALSMTEGNTVAIGACYNNGNGSNAGHVRVYRFCSNSANTIYQTGCNSYISPSGNHIWTSSGTYSDTLQSSSGCDSILTILLTINTVDVSVTNNAPTFAANAAGAAYQWLDCDNGFAMIPGATGQSFTATANGNYAVEITKNGCTDTSACIPITNIGITDHTMPSFVKIFPNPSNGYFYIIPDKKSAELSILIRNTLGQIVSRQKFSTSSEIKAALPAESGLYLIEVTSGDTVRMFRILKV